MRLIQFSFLMAFLLLSGFSAATANETLESYCAVSTDKEGKLSTARTLFQGSCANYKLVDCDPIKSGGWECSSEMIGANAPKALNNNAAEGQNANSAPATAATESNNNSNTGAGSNSTPAVSPSTPEASPVPTAVTNTQTNNSNSSQCYAVAKGLSQSKIAFAQQCAHYKRNDCDPLSNNRWVCSSASVSNTQPYEESDDTIAPTAETNTQSIAVTTAPTDAPAQPNNAVPENTQIGRLTSNDLLVLHYDNCPDKDDGHAIPSGKSVVEKYDINNVLVVNGTCGNSIRNRFNSASNSVIEASWGTEYLDAHTQRAPAIQEAITQWATTLSNGADVWIAEGGQSDFTADVVRQIESRYSNIDLKRIHVVQHSAGRTAYNEKFTDSANLSYLKNKTSYQAIANGNVGGNGTADLNQQSFYFVISAKASRFSAEWNAGFKYLQPDCTIRTENCKLDFSDTVELLYIVDDTSTQNVNDFANKYLN